MSAVVTGPSIRSLLNLRHLCKIAFMGMWPRGLRSASKPPFAKGSDSSGPLAFGNFRPLSHPPESPPRLIRRPASRRRVGRVWQRVCGDAGDWVHDWARIHAALYPHVKPGQRHVQRLDGRHTYCVGHKPGTGCVERRGVALGYARGGGERNHGCDDGVFHGEPL